MANLRKRKSDYSKDFSGQKTMTEQHHKNACDVNNILKKYKKTGNPELISKAQGFYADVSSGVDYHEALNKLHEIDVIFDTLNSDVRKRFKNDPAELLSFLGDDSNHEEAYELGLVETAPEPKKAPPAASIPEGDGSPAE
jgi:phage internal scaffolding protein